MFITLIVFSYSFINHNSSNLFRRTYRKRSISHLTHYSALFCCCFTCLSKVLLLTSVELKKSSWFIKWHQIKLAGFCSWASDMLPKSNPATAQTVGNLILLVLTKALGSSRDCTFRSVCSNSSACFLVYQADLFSSIMIRKSSQHTQTSLACGEYCKLNLIPVRIGKKNGAIIFCRSWWLRQNASCPGKYQWH